MKYHLITYSWRPSATTVEGRLNGRRHALLGALVVGFLTQIISFAWGVGEKSLYSDLTPKACQISSQAEEGEGDWVRYTCPGVLGYRLEWIEDDLRQNLILLGPNGKQDLGFFGKIMPGFNYLGEKVEWRTAGNKPIALIVRMYSNNAEKKSQVLIVSRISPKNTCVVRVIDALKMTDANSKARQIADQANELPCLW